MKNEKQPYDCEAGHDRLAELARELKQPVASGDLWERIERELENDAARVRSSGRPAPRRRWLAVSAAAAVVLGLGLAGVLLHEPGSRTIATDEPVLTRLVHDAEHERILIREASAMAALERIAPAVREIFDSSNPSAAGVRGQLAVLETNIEQCRRRTLANPRNRGIRIALLRSMETKLELVQAFLSRNAPDSKLTDTLDPEAPTEGAPSKEL